MHTVQRLGKGRRYDVDNLILGCWRDGEGVLILRTTDWDYFGDYFRDGVYLGPDEDGVEPYFIPSSVKVLPSVEEVQ